MFRPDDRAAAPPLPLRHRLPNAPPSFIGRAVERRYLGALIRRAPVTIVWGLGGLGKTSLVLHTLHADFADQAPRVLFVSLRPTEPPAAVEVELLRAVADAHRLAKVDWSGLLAEPDALLATLIDLADTLGYWVVLDDLHHADPRSARDVLGALARYARQSRWIVTSRANPLLPELVDQTLALAGMPSADLYELAARCAPHRSARDLHQVADASAGSPWRLRQLLTGGDAARASGDLLHGVPPEATPLLEALAALELPLAPAALAGLVPLPSPDVLEALEQRGILECSSAGLRLHDVARPLIETSGDLRARKAEVARALAAADDDPLSALEALRLLLALGHLDEAVALLESRCELVLGAGLAPRLAQLLAPVDLPRLASFRLRCAVEIGDPAALDAAVLPRSPTLGDHFLWAASHVLRGRLAEAATIAARVRRAALAVPQAAGLALTAALLETSCLGELGRTTEALGVLDGIPPPGRDAAALLGVHRARWLMQEGRVAEALECVEGLVAAGVDVAAPTTSELRDELIVLFCYLGRVRRLEQVLDTLALGAQRGPALLFGARRSLLTEALLCVHAGRLDQAREVFREVERLARRTTYLRPFLLALDAERRLITGELEGMEALLGTLHDEAARAEHALNQCFAVVTAYRVAIARGRPSALLDASALLATPYWAALLAAAARLHAVLHGLPPPPVPPLAEEIVHGRVLLALGAAAERAIAGDPEAARAHASAAYAVAREHGHIPGELEALRMSCDALLLAGDAAELSHAAGLLREQADAAGAPRFSAEARWFAATLDGAPHPSALEPFLDLSDVAPVAARRSRALLGASEALDRLDRAVLDVLSRRRAGPASRRDAASRAGWGLDTGARKVWLPGSRTVELMARPILYRILLGIAERSGRATKEQIVLFAWEQRDYHPLRDDKRLHVAIRKLRLLLEDDASRAQRLVTTADGYGFGEGEPFRLVTAAASPEPG